MAKVFIPQVGDKIELSQHWSCKIFNERRNSSVFDALGVDVSSQEGSNIDITFPKGTIFKVNRLYVRAPASSYDSLTLSVISSPIKKLSKAKFWVKIMDANNMEFESKSYNFEDFDNIKSLFRYIALKDGNTNEEKMTNKQQQPYLQEIVNHFSTPEKIISFDITLSKKDMLETYNLNTSTRYWHRDNWDYDREVAQINDLLPDNIVVTVTMYPALNGILYRFNCNETLKNIDQKLGYYEQYSTHYWNSQILGSFLSYNDIHFINSIKKEHINYVQEALEEKLDFNVGGKIQKIKNKTAFNKIVNSLH